MRCAIAALLWAFVTADSACANPVFKHARLQALNKVTARVSDLEAKPMLPIRFGTLEIEVHRCWRAKDDERPEQAALIEVRERTAKLGESKLLFSGWMFKNSPALSALQHPVYDVTLLSCR